MAAAVLLVVCAGIYMNWMYTNSRQVADFTDTLNAEKVLSEDFLSIEVDALEDQLNTVTDYFAAVRLSRQQARDSAVELLQEAMAYGNAGESSDSSQQLEQIMEDRRIYQYTESETRVAVTESGEKYTASVAAPIISEGDVLGLVLFVAEGDEPRTGETEYKLAQTIAAFLGKHMES